MVIIGVIFGLLCALLMSCSYLMVRQDSNTRNSQTNKKNSGGGFNLLVRSQTVQGIISAIALYWLWPSGLEASRELFWPAIGAGGFFLIGQAGLLTAMRYTQASRIAPLLSLKVAGVAFITVIFLGYPLSILQWLAVFMAVGAAFLLSYTGGKLPVKAALAAAVPCVFYACSDVCVGQTLAAADTSGISKFHLGLFVAAFVYALCGVAAICALPWGGSRKLSDWTWAVPFSITWMGAEVCLFICFALVGVVLGGILQSTRGVASIAIGALAATLGFEHLEQRISRSIFWRRMGAAALMSVAIAVYLFGK